MAGKWQSVCSFTPTTMSTLIQRSPGLNISQPGATSSVAGPTKLDFTRCTVANLYAALRRFDKRFSSTSQDVNDPVSRVASIPPFPICQDIAKGKANIMSQIFLPDSFGSEEVSSHHGRSHNALHHSFSRFRLALLHHQVFQQIPSGNPASPAGYAGCLSTTHMRRCR